MSPSVLGTSRARAFPLGLQDGWGMSPARSSRSAAHVHMTHRACSQPAAWNQPRIGESCAIVPVLACGVDAPRYPGVGIGLDDVALDFCRLSRVSMSLCSTTTWPCKSSVRADGQGGP